MTVIQRALEIPDVIEHPDALNIGFEAVEKILETLDSTPAV